MPCRRVLANLLPYSTMGALFAKLWNKLFNYAEFKIVIVGLDNAGKTTTLYKLYVCCGFFCANKCWLSGY